MKRLAFGLILLFILAALTAPVHTGHSHEKRPPRGTACITYSKGRS
ncbi:hypothetical protein [Salidesulfovibrio onnuriiensis]|nr:hypothetical protein [Salidesulfovibrio onnuriiensis]